MGDNLIDISSTNDVIGVGVGGFGNIIGKNINVGYPEIVSYYLIE